jgi:acetolactate synthase-1/2/3 large subunit
MRVADYIASFLVDHGITDMFSVVGGGAMHLNDAFGHCPGLHVTYNHHEQACAIAAESYARMTGKIAGVCVTTGPGGTNAITGVLGGWTDSIPMLVFSGQVKFSTTIASCPNLGLRQLGDQEFNIVDAVRPLTKYAVMVVNPDKIAYYLEKALFMSTHGRPGPCWIDVPLNVQGAQINSDVLQHFDPEHDALSDGGDGIPALKLQETVDPVSDFVIDEFIGRVNAARRPVIIAGDIVRTLNCYDTFRAVVEKLQIPVVTAWNAHDLMEDDDPLYAGRQGSAGTRGGNFVLQAADLVISLSSRLSIRQVSYNWENFAKNGSLIYIDIDEAELRKPTLSVAMPIHADIRDFMAKLLDRDYTFEPRARWNSWCHEINLRYPVCLPEYREKKSPVNMYVFFDESSRLFPEGSKIVCGNGAPCMAGFQTIHIKKGTRLYHNSGVAAMGWGLPASIGAAVALKGERIICYTGDGSIMMNLQELETVSFNKLNIKIFLLNNNGYQSIRITQTNLFDSNFAGVDPESGVGMPCWEKVAAAFDIPFMRIDSLDSMDEKIKEFLAAPGCGLCEVVCGTDQFWSPKLGAKRLPDGSMVSPSLEDMSPFLPEGEVDEVMSITKEC